MELGGIVVCALGWIGAAKDRDNWRALVNAANGPTIAWKSWKLSSSCTIGGSSRLELSSIQFVSCMKRFAHTVRRLSLLKLCLNQNNFSRKCPLFNIAELLNRSRKVLDSIYIYSVALSPRANYTDWATATCRRNFVLTFVDRGVSLGQRGGSATVANLSLLDRIYIYIVT
jgi:hypothetical protein